MLRDADKNEIREHFKIPDYIENCARAIRYDLLYGPSWSLIPKGAIQLFTSTDMFAQLREDMELDKQAGDDIEETYTGKVAKALRNYLDDLPSESYYDTFAGEYLKSKPKGFQDDDGTWVEPNLDDLCKLESRDLVEILFGKTIAREFR